MLRVYNLPRAPGFWETLTLERSLLKGFALWLVAMTCICILLRSSPSTADAAGALCVLAAAPAEATTDRCEIEVAAALQPFLAP